MKQLSNLHIKTSIISGKVGTRNNIFNKHALHTDDVRIDRST